MNETNKKKINYFNKTIEGLYFPLFFCLNYLWSYSCSKGLRKSKLIITKFLVDTFQGSTVWQSMKLKSQKPKFNFWQLVKYSIPLRFIFFCRTEEIIYCVKLSDIKKVCSFLENEKKNTSHVHILQPRIMIYGCCLIINYLWSIKPSIRHCSKMRLIYIASI